MRVTHALIAISVRPLPRPVFQPHQNLRLWPEHRVPLGPRHEVLREPAESGHAADREKARRGPDRSLAYHPPARPAPHPHPTPLPTRPRCATNDAKPTGERAETQLKAKDPSKLREILETPVDGADQAIQRYRQNRKKTAYSVVGTNNYIAPEVLLQVRRQPRRTAAWGGSVRAADRVTHAVGGVGGVRSATGASATGGRSASSCTRCCTATRRSAPTRGRRPSCASSTGGRPCGSPPSRASRRRRATSWSASSATTRTVSGRTAPAPSRPTRSSRRSTGRPSGRRSRRGHRRSSRPPTRRALRTSRPKRPCP